MKIDRVKKILYKIQNVNITVYGDFCIDAYWIMDLRGSEISVETGLKAEAVDRHYYTLGGASNIVANIAALGPAKIRVIGAIGDDIFGRELQRQFQELNVDTESLIIQQDNFDTVTFAKRYVDDVEQPRIDFGFNNKRTRQTDDLILDSLKKALQRGDVVIFNQQVPGSITNAEFIEQANALFREFDDRIVLLDSRNYGDQFTSVLRKINEAEAAGLLNISFNENELISCEQVIQFAGELFKKYKKPVIITRGANGMVTIDQNEVHTVPGIRIVRKVDPVGAGDTVTSALALCLGAGVLLAESAEFANIAAAVTVQKHFQTGTASAEEILKIAEVVDYVHQPELAADQRKAHYINGTNIEACYPPEKIPLGRIKHAVFDHDGTISTLRQGWEDIMEPMMIKAILGSKFETADNSVYRKVQSHVRDYIDKTTGIQTIIQMEDLVAMVSEFGFVPESEIRDKFGYKEIYNQSLMEMVNQRIAQFKNGQLDISDFTIKGAIPFLTMLREKGITLYLASGTDREDVINEARVLGYADLFDGGIYGAVGDVSRYSKKMVIDRIMDENQLHGAELAVFGDGPVELLECRKRDGIAVGIASDEIRRHGLNLEKRSRLIKAGALLVMPDFSECDELIKLLLK